jgi:hypothetical protein
MTASSLAWRHASKMLPVHYRNGEVYSQLGCGRSPRFFVKPGQPIRSDGNGRDSDTLGVGISRRSCAGVLTRKTKSAVPRKRVTSSSGSGWWHLRAPSMPWPEWPPGSRGTP